VVGWGGALVKPLVNALVGMLVDWMIARVLDFDVRRKESNRDINVL
jgi:hypothetical protein